MGSHPKSTLSKEYMPLGPARCAFTQNCGVLWHSVIFWQAICAVQHVGLVDEVSGVKLLGVGLNNQMGPTVILGDWVWRCWLALTYSSSGVQTPGSSL